MIVKNHFESITIHFYVTLTLLGLVILLEERSIFPNVYSFVRFTHWLPKTLRRAVSARASQAVRRISLRREEIRTSFPERRET